MRGLGAMFLVGGVDGAWKRWKALAGLWGGRESARTDLRPNAETQTFCASSSLPPARRSYSPAVLRLMPAAFSASCFGVTSERSDVSFGAVSNSDDN